MSGETEIMKKALGGGSLTTEEEEKSAKQFDLFDCFGHGIKSYFFMMQELIRTYIVLSLLFGIIGSLYVTGDTRNLNLSMTTLGNLNQPEFICSHRYMQTQEPYHLECRKGEINELKYFGVIPDTDLRPKDNPLEYYDYCGDPNKIELTKQCTTEMLNSKALRNVFQRDCYGKKSCKLDFRKFKPKDLINDDTPVPSYCKGKFTTYYLQYDCHLEDDYK